MQCIRCGFENPEGMSYCGNCGSPLTRTCPSCGQGNPPTFRFCGFCGTPLEAAAPVAPEPAALLEAAQSGSAPGRERRLSSAGALPEGERLQLTLMFCDLVGSTALSTRLDPEELHEIVQSYQSSCGEIIERFGGYVAQHLGDGILAYFGYPVAHEREAGAAVRSGLAILGAVNDLNRSLGDRLDVQLAVRIGIHTGVAMVGPIGGGERRERLALGEVPNIAARLQALAEPNTVVVSAATYRLVSYEFDWKELGQRTIRGLERKERVYRVIGERSGGDSCQDAPATGVPLPLGRDRELAVLHERWRQAIEGRGQVVVINGDSGIGKTNLVHGFVSQLEPGSFLLLEGHCQPYYQNTAYHPIIDLLQRQLDCPVERGPLEQRRALVALLEREGLPVAETAPLLSLLLSIPADEPDPPPGYLPQPQKERTRAALIHLFFQMSQRRPLILCIEDLHWADPSSLELLELLAGKVATERALLLLTHRPGYHCVWQPQLHLAAVNLDRLDADRVAEIVGRVTGGRPLPAEVLEQIVQKTDGVPLFVEELTKMVLESGMLRDKGDRFERRHGALPPLAIPATLHDSLEARLDRLAASKELVQIAATLGREFSYTLLRAVSDLDEPVLQRSLAKLVDAELLEEQGTPPDATYVFKHRLIQEVAYQSLLRSVRQRHHERIARVLESDFSDLAASHPELLAQHYTAAGLALQAFEHWLRAGHRALERSASQEALAHLRAAQELLPRLRDVPGRAQRELELNLALGPALLAEQGYTSDNVLRIYGEALRLAEEVGDDVSRFHALCGRFAAHFVRAEFHLARTLADQLLEIAEQTQSDAMAVAAHTAAGITLVEGGAYRKAHEHLTQAVDLYEMKTHAPLMYLSGQDYCVVALCYDGYALWTLGYPEQALQRAREAVALARSLEHSHSLALALACLAAVHHFRREPEPARTVAEELATLCSTAGFRHWELQVHMFRGWVLCEQGGTEEGEEGIACLREAIAHMQGPAAAIQAFPCYRMLGEALIRAGRAEEALAVLAEVEAKERSSGIAWWTAEIQRLHAAAIALTVGGEAEAELLLRRALEVAREQQASSFELRIATDLARLLLRQGRAAEARAALEPVYGRFTEGQDLPDLQEAASVLRSAIASVPALA